MLSVTMQQNDQKISLSLLFTPKHNYTLYFRMKKTLIVSSVVCRVISAFVWVSSARTKHVKLTFLENKFQLKCQYFQTLLFIINTSCAAVVSCTRRYITFCKNDFECKPCLLCS